MFKTHAHAANTDQADQKENSKVQKRIKPCIVCRDDTGGLSRLCTLEKRFSGVIILFKRQNETGLSLETFSRKFYFSISRLSKIFLQ